jgi:hypothetical protein
MSAKSEVVNWVSQMLFFLLDIRKIPELGCRVEVLIKA